MSHVTIGRLHRLECASSLEYQNLTVGETLQAKILRVTNGKQPKQS